jgi:hypothetical protein
MPRDDSETPVPGSPAEQPPQLGKEMWGLTGARPGLRMAAKFARRNAM